ncbi:DUF1636 family protein [Bradyrhizobium sp. BRP22]|uniref:DUF1636 family protein n=1 Tax=Bradyrhizobium sp. BRP22 TaxID=2793821 RepID=UPI001CD36ACA|nr:DUF1636 family protein [Bradyrhizobium sp. BRP22]
MTITLHFCITCPPDQTLTGREAAPGAYLHSAIFKTGVAEGVNLKPIETLSICSQGCSIAPSAAARWPCLYGRLSDTNARMLLPSVRPPWRRRLICCHGAAGRRYSAGKRSPVFVSSTPRTRISRMVVEDKVATLMARENPTAWGVIEAWLTRLHEEVSLWSPWRNSVAAALREAS